MADQKEQKWIIKAVNRKRTENTKQTTKKNQRSTNDLHNTTQKTKD